MPLLDNFHFLEQELLKAVKSYYGDRLLSLAIFGSAGRYTHRADSDLDFLIVANDRLDILDLLLNKTEHE